MYETIHEYVNSENKSLRIDKSSGVIYDVKILGMQSRNNREYPASTLTHAVSLYENARVNLDHPEGDPRKPRSYQDRLGVIRGVRFIENDGIYANFHFNPMHPLAEQLVWDAEHFPGNVGFSHNVDASISRTDERVVVDKIIAVRSVDLVADPATTSGLFESDHSAGDENDTTHVDNTTVDATNDVATYKRQVVLLRNLCEMFAAEFSHSDDPAAKMFHKTFLDHLCDNIDSDIGNALIRDRISLVKQCKTNQIMLENRPVSKSRELLGSGEGVTNDTVSFVASITS